MGKIPEVEKENGIPAVCDMVCLVLVPWFDDRQLHLPLSSTSLDTFARCEMLLHAVENRSIQGGSSDIL